jgi:hypothetical protein
MRMREMRVDLTVHTRIIRSQNVSRCKAIVKLRLDGAGDGGSIYSALTGGECYVGQMLLETESAGYKPNPLFSARRGSGQNLDPESQQKKKKVLLVKWC